MTLKKMAASILIRNGGARISARIGANKSQMGCRKKSKKMTTMISVLKKKPHQQTTVVEESQMNPDIPGTGSNCATLDASEDDYRTVQDLLVPELKVHFVTFVQTCTDALLYRY